MLRKCWLLGMSAGLMLCVWQLGCAAQMPLTQTRSYMAKGDGDGKIYFAKMETGEKTFPICSMNVDGSQVKSIANGTLPALWTADFSPDHSMIAYVVENEMGDDIYTAKADGSGAAKIYSTGDMIGQVRFSPDGQSIAFTTQDIEGGQTNGMLVVMTITGANPRSLSPIRVFPKRSLAQRPNYKMAPGRPSMLSVSGTNVTSNTVTGMFAFSPDSKKIAYTRDTLLDTFSP